MKTLEDLVTAAPSLARRAALARCMCWIVAAIAVGNVLYLWADRSWLSAVPGLGPRVTTTPLTVGVATLAASLPLLALTGGLVALARMFGRMQVGRVMVRENAAALRRTGWLFAAAALLFTLGHTVAVLALTYANPPGERVLSISLGPQQLGTLVIGVVMLVFGLVMQEAAAQSDEVKGFV